MPFEPSESLASDLDEFALGELDDSELQEVMRTVWLKCPQKSHPCAHSHYNMCDICIGEYVKETIYLLQRAMQ